MSKKGGKRGRKLTASERETHAEPIDVDRVLRNTVRDFARRGVDVVGGREGIPDVNGNELWHRYDFQFPDTFSPDDVPQLAEIARARIRTFGYRGMTSIRVQGGVGEKGNLIGTGERTLSFTRKFDAAFKSTSDRLKQLKARGSVQNVITGLSVYVRAPREQERALRRKGKLGSAQTQTPRRAGEREKSYVDRARASQKGKGKK